VHPWLEAVPSPPGKAAHVAALLRVQQSIDPMRGRMVPVINPLLAQPIVELALGIPSWRWREGGTDRAVARQAFATSLPDQIVARRGKGGPDGFSRAVIVANQVVVRERLMEGRLVARGIVDRTALAEALAPGAAVAGNDHVRLQELLVAEAWLDHWAGVGPAI
jgi:asparagine synthase (glutamine-hydrolysing)